MNPLEHAIYKIRNAKINRYPFPHFYVENVFPEDFYWQMLERFPADDKYAKSDGGYKNRLFADPVDPDFAPFHGKLFTQNMLETFRDHFHTRFPDNKAAIRSEWRLVRDDEGYYIGPHTDARWKVLSLLFYLPRDHSYDDAGTSIYIPQARDFTNEGGPHFPFAGFEKVWTAPYVPNSCFGFWKTDNSWHGVEQISRKMRRDVLLFNVYDANLMPGPQKP